METSKETSKETLQSRSVDNLRALFNIIAGLSLVESVRSIIVYDMAQKQLNPNYGNVPLFMALFFTIMPFHHGASRYLDNKYVASDEPVRKLEGLLDFFIFMIEAMLFYAASLSIHQPKTFFSMLIIILVVDVVWIGFVYFSGDKSIKMIKNWAILNLVAVFLIAIVNYTALLPDYWIKWAIISALFLVRTILDYALTWEFYWPK